MKNITIELTRQCNFQCSHCYISAGPSGKTLSLPQIKQLIDHLPKDLAQISLTGGEVFTQKALLYETLNYIRQKSFENLKWVNIFTNGFWFEDEESIKKILNELKSFRLPIWLVVTYDQYHAKAGAPPFKNFILFSEILKEFSSGKHPIASNFSQDSKPSLFAYLKAKYWGQRRWEFTLMPGGRAKKEIERIPLLKLLNRWFWIHKRPCGSARGLWRGTLYINVDGEVFGCCALKHKSFGNAIATPTSELMIGAKNNPYFQALNEGGPRKVALMLGVTETEIKKRLRSRWECDFCEEITKEFFAK